MEFDKKDVEIIEKYLDEKIDTVDDLTDFLKENWDNFDKNTREYIERWIDVEDFIDMRERLIDIIDMEDEDMEDEYRDYLDEMYDEVVIDGRSYGGAEIVEVLDYVAYEVGYDEYIEDMVDETEVVLDDLTEKTNELLDEIVYIAREG